MHTILAPLSVMKPVMSARMAVPTREELILSTAITKNIVGAGMFALSAALSTSRTGLVPGLALVALSACASCASFCMVAEATAASSEASPDADIRTTEDLWRRSVGPAASLIAMFTLLQATGTLVQYSATLSELLGPAVAMVSRRMRLLWVALALLPLCLAEDIQGLRHSSTLGLAGVLYSVGFVCWRALDGSYAPGGRWHGAPPIVPALGAAASAVGADAADTAIPVLALGWPTLSLLGVLNTAYFAPLNVPAYWRSWTAMHATGGGGATQGGAAQGDLTQGGGTTQGGTTQGGTTQGGTAQAVLRARFVRAASASFAFVALAYCLVLVVGVRTFGTGGGDSRLLLLRYAAADRGANLMRVATLASVGTAYPLVFHALRDVVCAAVLPAGAPTIARKALSAGLLAAISALALNVDNLTKLIAVRGAALGSLLVYTLPAILALASGRSAADARTDRQDGQDGSWARRARALTSRQLALGALGIYGILSSIVGTAAALR